MAAEVAPLWFTPETEKKSQNPRKFRIEPLNSVQMWEINTHLKLIDSQHIAITFEGQKLALKYGLLDWENVKDKDGKTMPCDPSNWTHLNSWTLNIVAKEIISISELADAERKN